MIFFLLALLAVASVTDALIPLFFGVQWIFIAIAAVIMLAPVRSLWIIIIAGVIADLFAGSLVGATTIAFAFGILGAQRILRILDPVLIVSRAVAGIVFVFVSFFVTAAWMFLSHLSGAHLVNPIVVVAFLSFIISAGIIIITAALFSLATLVFPFLNKWYVTRA